VATSWGNSPNNKGHQQHNNHNGDRKRCQLIFCTISIDLTASWCCCFVARSNGSHHKSCPDAGWSRRCRFVDSAKWNELTIWCNCDFFVCLFLFFWTFFLFFGRTRPQRSEFKRNAYRASKKSSNTNGNGNSSGHKTWNWKCQTLKDN